MSLAVSTQQTDTRNYYSRREDVAGNWSIPGTANTDRNDRIALGQGSGRINLSPDFSKMEFHEAGARLRSHFNHAHQAVLDHFKSGASHTLLIDGVDPKSIAEGMYASLSATGVEPLAFDDSDNPSALTTIGSSGNAESDCTERADLGFCTQGPHFGVDAMADGHASAPSVIAIASDASVEPPSISVLNADTVADLIDQNHFETLFAPYFRIARPGRREAADIPLLGTNRNGRIHIRFDWQWTGVSRDAPRSAKTALNALRMALVQAPRSIYTLGPGQILLIDNRFALHAIDNANGRCGRILRMSGRNRCWQGRLASCWPLVAIA